jgi:hypothetical protein
MRRWKEEAARAQQQEEDYRQEEKRPENRISEHANLLARTQLLATNG